jgi:hypothetical protein
VNTGSRTLTPSVISFRSRFPPWSPAAFDEGVPVTGVVPITPTIGRYGRRTRSLQMTSPSSIRQIRAGCSWGIGPRNSAALGLMPG